MFCINKSNLLSIPVNLRMLWYEELLAREEEFRKTEQSLLLSALLSNPGRGTLSILRRAGLAMTGMEVEGRSCGAGGRIVLEMVSGISGTKNNSSSSNNTNNESDSSTVNCFKPGELVKLIVNGQLLKCTGTIERSRPQSNLQCRVSLSDTIDDEEMEMIMNGRVAVIKIVDETGGFDKMKRNLEFIEKEAEGEGELIRDVREFIKMIEKSGIKKSELEPECAEPIDNSTDSHKEALNFEQGLAVEEALGMLNDPSRNLLLIHGPPGTGKTSTLLEIIKQIKLTKNSLKILICGPSNLSVDNIVEGLLRVKGFETEGGKLLRVGHPSRVLESCQGTTLDFWSEHSDAGKLLKDVQREIDEIVKNQLPRCKSREERRELYGELKLLRQERRKREKSLQVELLKRADIVVCTLSTASGKKIFNLDKFDLAILDEAGQSLLPESLVAPLLAKKLIMAGDHCQLPPTVMNPEIKNQLEVSLFELFIRGKKGKSVMLREQYRMNELIMKWSNEVFYGNNLRAHETVRNWTLTEQSDVLVFYDTCGFDLWESEEKSKGNGNGKSLLIEGEQCESLIFFLINFAFRNE